MWSGCSAIYDIAHAGANRLKRRFEKDERWPAFVTWWGRAKAQSQQTEAAYLVGPSLRPKARYMNLGPVLKAARRTLRLLDAPTASADTRARVEAKYGWLREYCEALDEWWAWQQTVQTIVAVVRQQGLHAGIGPQRATALESVPSVSEELASEMVSFVTEQSRACRPGERLPASTEALESCFGTQKTLERQQSQSGFTGLVLALGAIVTKRTAEKVKAARDATPLKTLKKWCDDHLGPSVQAQRRQAFQGVPA
jgi:hypothetical protein